MQRGGAYREEKRNKQERRIGGHLAREAGKFDRVATAQHMSYTCSDGGNEARGEIKRPRAPGK